MRQTHVQFTIRRAMEVVAVAAIVLWLLRFSAETWSIVVTSLTLAALGVAVLGARFHRGRVGAFCVGVALSGLTCFFYFGSPTLAQGSVPPRQRIIRSLVTIPVAAAGGSVAGTCYGPVRRLMAGPDRHESDAVRQHTGDGPA